MQTLKIVASSQEYSFFPTVMMYTAHWCYFQGGQCAESLYLLKSGETSTCNYKLLAQFVRCTTRATVAVESDVVFIKFEDGKFILQQFPPDITDKLFRTRSN